MSSSVPERASEEAPPPLKERRRLLALISVAAGAVAASIVGIPVVGFVFAPMFRRTREEWRGVGAVEGFRIGTTVEVTFRDASARSWAGTTAETGAWLRREAETEFIAFALNCTHLGCPVRWVAEAELFMCPCHGGVYYQDGKVAAGPPPRALTRFPVRVRDGNVEVRTTPIPIT